MLMSAEGNILRSDVAGAVQMRCFLSGMPECKFGMNDKVLMDKESKGTNTKRHGSQHKTLALITLTVVTGDPMVLRLMILHSTSA